MRVTGNLTEKCSDMRLGSNRRRQFYRASWPLVGRGRCGSPPQPFSPAGSGYREAVDPRCGAAVERRLFGRRDAGGDALEGVPQLGVAAGLLVRREVALEHAAVDAAGFDAGLDILAPCGGEVPRGRTHLARVGVEA